MVYYRVCLQNTIERPWTNMEPVYIGDVPKGLGTPSHYCTVERGKEPFQLEPFRLLNLYGASQFADAQIWQTWLVLGFGSFIYFVPLEEGKPIYYDIGYFWSLYPADDYMLVTSVSNVSCYNQQARQLWKSEWLGYHGVQISDVQAGRVTGMGNYPPFDEPAGQIPFVLSLDTGKIF